MAQSYKLPEISARLSTTNKPSYHQQAVQADRVAKAQAVPQSSRTGDMSPAMRETLGNLGTAGQLAGRAMREITKGVSQASMTQYQKQLKGKVDKMNDLAGKMGDQRDQMASKQGEMDALQSAMNMLQNMGCAAKDELDKLQQQYDQAKSDYDQAEKNMQQSSDQLNRAQQDLTNQMNKSYPNTPQGRRQDFMDERAAREAVNNAEYNQSMAQGEMERTGYNANEAARLRNQSLESFGELQGQIEGNAADQAKWNSDMAKQQADYLNNMRDMQQTQREFAQTSRDMYETAMNQARISQGGSTLEAVGSMAKDVANGEYWSAGAKAANQTLDWAKMSGSLGNATPLLPYIKNLTTAVAQAADRGANGYGMLESAMNATFGYNELNAGYNLQKEAFDAAARGEIGTSISKGMQSAYPISKAVGTTAENFLPLTPFGAATPFARPAAQGVGQGFAAAGRSFEMSELYMRNDRVGNGLAEGLFSPVTGMMAGVGEAAQTLTGIPGLQKNFEDVARELSKFSGDVAQKGIFDDLFKEPPNTSEQLRLDNNRAQQKTGDSYNSKNPSKSNPNYQNNNCPKPIKPRQPDNPTSGQGTGNPYQ